MQNMIEVVLSAICLNMKVNNVGDLFEGIWLWLSRAFKMPWKLFGHRNQ